MSSVPEKFNRISSTPAYRLVAEARLARLRGFKVSQKNGSMKTAMGRVKEWFVGNF